MVNNTTNYNWKEKFTKPSVSDTVDFSCDVTGLYDGTVDVSTSYGTLESAIPIWYRRLEILRSSVYFHLWLEEFRPHLDERDFSGFLVTCL